MNHKHLPKAKSIPGAGANQAMDPDAEKPLNSPKIDQVEFDELIAQRVFEKAKIATYYGILGVLGGLVLALSTWAKIDSALDARINTVVAPALTNAQIRI